MQTDNAAANHILILARSGRFVTVRLAAHPKFRWYRPPACDGVLARTRDCDMLPLVETPALISDLKLCQATTPGQLAAVRALFLEYAASLEISLCFQNFEQELVALPGNYAPPEGRLLLAWRADQAAGCVGLRPLEQGVCEMKRLYVRPAWRGQGVGHFLAASIISAAKELGYACMRLDTLASMRSAISLYRTLGFRIIPAYYANPSPEAVFMELTLRDSLASTAQDSQSLRK